MSQFEQPNLDLLMETLQGIRTAADTACDTAEEAGITGGINRSDLGVVEVRFCISENGKCSYEVVIRGAAPAENGLIEHIRSAIDQAHLAYPLVVRTE